MTDQGHEPVLIVRLKGAATKDGRIGLQELLLLGKCIQVSVERVARVLVGQTDSRRRGRKPPEIAGSCALEVVALNRGSFEMAFDVPHETFDVMHLGIDAVEKLLDGFAQMGSNGDPLPSGYDKGVLLSLRDMGRILERNIDEIEMESHTRRQQRRVSFNRDFHNRVAMRVRGPVSSMRTVEGRLLMADFRHNAERCRIHPPVGEPIVCRFPESMEDAVYENLRGYVRLAGETQEDSTTGRITSITVMDIEPLTMAEEGREFETITAEQFWIERSLEQLAVEQEVRPVQRLEDVWGKGADLWEDDDDFVAFLAATKGSPTERA